MNDTVTVMVLSAFGLTCATFGGSLTFLILTLQKRIKD